MHSTGKSLKDQILETLSLTPMGPKAIVSLFSREFSFEEISTGLFDLFDNGEIKVNNEHKFYTKDGGSE